MQFNLDTLFYYIIECVVQKLDMQCTFINGMQDLHKQKCLQF